MNDPAHVMNIATRDKKQRDRAIRRAGDEVAAAYLHDWAKIGRPDQHAPKGEWKT